MTRTHTLSALALLASTLLGSSAQAGFFSRNDEPAYEPALLARLEAYNYPARYIAAYESNARLPVDVRPDTSSPLARKSSAAAMQETLTLQKLAQSNFGLLKLGYIWAVGVSPETNTETALDSFVNQMQPLLEQHCDLDPERRQVFEGQGHSHKLVGSCRRNGGYTEILSQPIADYSVLHEKFTAGSQVSWVLGQASLLKPADIRSIQKQLPKDFYLVFADTLKNPQGEDLRIVRVFKNGDERGYMLPLPPAF